MDTSVTTLCVDLQSAQQQIVCLTCTHNDIYSIGHPQHGPLTSLKGLKFTVQKVTGNISFSYSICPQGPKTESGNRAFMKSAPSAADSFHAYLKVEETVSLSLSESKILSEKFLHSTVLYVLCLSKAFCRQEKLWASIGTQANCPVHLLK